MCQEGQGPHLIQGALLGQEGPGVRREGEGEVTDRGILGLESFGNPPQQDKIRVRRQTTILLPNPSALLCKSGEHTSPLFIDQPANEKLLSMWPH